MRIRPKSMRDQMQAELPDAVLAELEGKAPVRKPGVLYCRAIGCTRHVANERRLMCEAHWALVPEAIQTAIWKKYEPAEESQSREYWEAVGQAVTHVEETQSTKQEAA